MAIDRLSRRLILIVGCFFCCCWGVVVVILQTRAEALLVVAARRDGSTALEPNKQSLKDDGAPPVAGTSVTLGASTKTEAVYALPGGSVKGIALLLHACTHSALKFFSPSSACTECVGLSEELRISRILLSKGYAVLAPSSFDRRSGCWGGDRDMERVRTALHEFQTNILIDDENRNDNKVILAIGASSGGRFAAFLSAHGIAHGALVMVSPLGEPLVHRLLDGDDMPPIYLAPMPKDKGTLKRARGDYELLHKKHEQRIVWDDTTCMPIPVKPEFLQERVPNMTRNMAERIVNALIKGRFVDPHTLFWLKDPTRSDWRTVLRQDCGELCLLNQNLDPGQSPLAKAFHRAWAFHEYCSEVVPKALDFFENVL